MGAGQQGPPPPSKEELRAAAKTNILSALGFFVTIKVT
jgi:hypothetical protein